jgi:hypothetical protein
LPRPSSRGGIATLDARRRFGKPFLLVYQGITRPSKVVAWIEEKGIRTLNLAGNRESAAPGIDARVERFLAMVFCQLQARGLIEPVVG